MRSRLLKLALVTLLLSAPAVVHAQTADQTVTFEVQAISDIEVVGDPGPLVISDLADPVTDSSTTYSITTNVDGQKITAELDEAMPTGLTLTVELESPTGATAGGAVELSESPADAVTDISRVAETGLEITYTLSATLDAEVGDGTRTVTFTLTDDV